MTTTATRKKGPNVAIANQESGAEKRPDFAEPIVFSRKDWTELRDINRITAKAGVPVDKLPRVVVKELVDNALDAGGSVRFGLLPPVPGEFSFYVANDGDGIPGTDDDIAERFSITRPLTSSKILRRPSRGMLGNGLRVVAGVCLHCCHGEVRVATRGRTRTLRGDADTGSTLVTSAAPWSGSGTRIEVVLRGKLATTAANDADIFVWGETAKSLTGGGLYKGKSSPHWYDSGTFWELLSAAGDTRLDKLVANLDGCSARERTAAVVGEYGGRLCGDLDRTAAESVLSRAKSSCSPVAADRLGKVGRLDDFAGYGKSQGSVSINGASLPFTIEVWANRSDEPRVMVCVNRTPIVTDVRVSRTDDVKYAIFGAGLGHSFDVGRKHAGEFSLVVNLITPAVPLTSSGKDPDLNRYVDRIVEACDIAVGGAKRNTPRKQGPKRSQKSTIISRIPAAVQELGDGVTLYSLRQLFYFVRPALLELLGHTEPRYGTFCRVITDYETSQGNVEGLYRDDRGTLLHPHTGENIPLGTRSVAGYSRPAWGFNKVLYCEKEGFFPILQNARWPERHDCALLTSKGYATKAARDVMSLMSKSGEPVQFYCIHDADGPGTQIYESLRRALKSHNVKVVNLGLEPAEGRAMGLQRETFKKKRKGAVVVGKYVDDADQDWLQSNRIELNAMTTPQFLAWLDAKMKAHAAHIGKVVPPAEVIAERLTTDARAAVERAVTEAVLREAKVGERIEALMKARAGELARRVEQIVEGLSDELAWSPEKHWSEVVRQAAQDVASRISPP